MAVKGNAGKTVAKINSPTAIATTIVESGPRDNITRVDGYGKQTLKPLDSTINQTLNKYRSDFFSNYQGLLSSLNLPSFDLKSMKGLEGIGGINNILADGAKQIAGLKSRIENSLFGGRSIESLTKIPQEFKNDLIGSLSKYTGGINVAGLDIGHMVKTGQMAYKDAVGVYNIVKRGDWTSLQGITQALNALGGTKLGDLIKPIVDVTAISAFMGNITREISKLGIPNIIKEVKSYFVSSRDRNHAIVAASWNAVQRGDLEMLEDILEVLGDGNIHQIRSNYRYTVEWLLRNYKLTPLFQPKDIKEVRKKLLTVLEKIDPKWWYEEINGERVYRLDVFRNCSKDVRRLLNYEDKESYIDTSIRDVLLIAPSYGKQNVKTLATSMYNNLIYRNRRSTIKKLKTA